MFSPQYSATVLRSDLGASEGSLADDYLQITAAIDFLIGGF